MFVIAWRFVYEILNDETKLNELKGKLTPSSTSCCSILSNTRLSEKSKKQPINFSTVVSLRSFLKDLDHNCVSWMCNCVFTSFVQDTNIDEKDYWKSNFWKQAQLEAFTIIFIKIFINSN